MNAVTRLKTLLCPFIAILFIMPVIARADTLMSKVVSIDAKRMPLQKILELISRRGNFYFSYNSTIINGDSLVTFSASNASIKQVLSQLLKNYQYSETGNYIIIKKLAAHAVVVNDKSVTQAESYIITGDITDDRTGKGIGNASVYEKDRLVSTLTNESGHFSIKLYSKYPSAAITISKQYYEDTTITVQPKYNQHISISLVPADSLPEVITISPVPVNLPADSLKTHAVIDSSQYIYTTKKVDSSRLERTKLVQFLLSSRQKIQDLNIDKFIATRPYQISVTPGLSTHGKLSTQVVNEVSLNIFGGYNAGVRGFELGGLFNINRLDVSSVQISGVFSLTGGSAEGVQLAGVTNIVHGNLNSGVQVAGVYNHVERNAGGIQLAGGANYTHFNMRGIQASVGANISNGSMDGVQAGFFNYTKKLHGVQIGLINIAGRSNGYSLGLINFVMNGYHKVYAYTDEIFPMNIAFKSGSTKMYSILIAGAQAKQNEKLYTFGYGLGTELRLGRMLSVNPEISTQYVYRGGWKYTNLLNKFSPEFNLKLNNTFTITGGPVINVYYSNQTTNVAGYKNTVGYTDHRLFNFSNNKLNSWLGWNVGLTVF